jgi:hypothetical protein
MNEKFPKIKHLPFSMSSTSDDVWLDSTISFWDEKVVVAEKIDGECTTMTRESCYARSPDSKNSHHPSRSYVKQLHAAIKQEIPEGWRICGEGTYAKHSIYYDGLPSYYLVFGVFDDKDVYLSWDQVEEWAKLLGFPTVPVLYKGIYNDELEKKLMSFWPFASLLGAPEAEGFVVRKTSAIYPGWSHAYPDCDCGECNFGDDSATTSWDNSISKFVRPSHVKTDKHWFNNWSPNKLASDFFASQQGELYSDNQ